MFRPTPSAFLLLAVSFGVRGVAGTFELPPLPYEYTALEPHIGELTLEVHHDKHHAKYVNTVNSMIEGVSEWEGSTLTDILKASYGKDQGLFNNAAQSWNHEFYWNCMTGSFQEPPQGLLSSIEKDFGSLQTFKSEFAKAGNSAFGSGWAWLVFDGSTGKLNVTKTIGADNPMAMDENLTPILTMDVWEHAYYLDYQNMRGKYVDTFLEKLVNWAYVAENLEAAALAASQEL